MIIFNINNYIVTVETITDLRKIAKNYGEVIKYIPFLYKKVYTKYKTTFKIIKLLS